MMWHAMRLAESGWLAGTSGCTQQQQQQQQQQHSSSGISFTAAHAFLTTKQLV
jgi:hypothetical protein